MTQNLLDGYVIQLQDDALALAPEKNGLWFLTRILPMLFLRAIEAIAIYAQAEANNN
jgi:hypothetical protein